LQVARAVDVGELRRSRLALDKAVLVNDRVRDGPELGHRGIAIHWLGAELSLEVGAVRAVDATQIARPVAAVVRIVDERRAIPIDDRVDEVEAAVCPAEVRRDRVENVAEARAYPVDYLSGRDAAEESRVARGVLRTCS